MNGARATLPVIQQAVGQFSDTPGRPEIGGRGSRREWFLVPLSVIDDAVQRIRDGSITDVVYDPKTARLVQK